MVNHIQSYNLELQNLEHPQKSKIEKILHLGCLQFSDPELYYCRPIVGYNTNTYALRRNHQSGEWVCNCQGHNKRGDCSHKQALYLHFKVDGIKLENTLF